MRFTAHCGIILLLAFCSLATAQPRTGVVRTKAQEAIVAAAQRQLAADPAAYNAYVGPEACLACHPNYGEWRKSLHATGLKVTPDDRTSMITRSGIIADYDKNGVDDFRQGLDFNKISSAFNAYKPNAPILQYSAASGYTIQIGPMTYPVAFVHGGSGAYKQRFVLRIPVTDTATGFSAGVYYSPVQYNEATQAYVVYEPSYWYKADNTVKITSKISAKDAAAGKSFDKGCSGCHSTTLNSVGKDANGEYVSVTPTPVYVAPDDNHYLDLRGKGEADMYHIGCETCHGPGARHIINRGDPKKIVNPARDFTAKQQNFQCGSCHSRGASVPSGVHEFPYDEAAKQEYPRFAPTEDLFTRYFQNKPGVYPDGKTSRQHHQQLQDLMRSAKWEFEQHKVTCVECHDPHAASPAQIRKTLATRGSDGAALKINVSVNNNSLCLGCHAGFGPFQALKKEQIADLAANSQAIAQVVTAHTRHPYTPEGTLGLSRCTNCHMAAMASSGAPYDMHSHTFAVVPPEATLKYQSQGGMPNSCATCHRKLAPAIGAPPDLSISAWNEASDVSVATWLMKYFGPEGVWWKKSLE